MCAARGVSSHFFQLNFEHRNVVHGPVSPLMKCRYPFCGYEPDRHRQLLLSHRVTVAPSIGKDSDFRARNSASQTHGSLTGVRPYERRGLPRAPDNRRLAKPLAIASHLRWHLARSLRQAITFIERSLTNAVTEGINRIVKIAKSRASGCRGLHNFADVIYLIGGDPDMSEHIASTLKTL